MDDLLEMILLQSELLELKANPDRPAVATVVEAHLDQKLGSVATILINAGTIKKGDNIVCGGAF
jgi:translation initiation factor IF-2